MEHKTNINGAGSKASPQVKSWKIEFKVGELFKIKGHIFRLANIGKRGMMLRKVSEKSENQSVGIPTPKNQIKKDSAT